VLLAVPNVSEGRDRTTIDAIATAFGVPLLDVHSDADHHRTVYTFAGDTVVDALLTGAREAIARIDLNLHAGVHPRVGALDVAPVVYLNTEDRGQAIAEALVLADRLAHELDLPVHLYGELGRPRAEVRRDPGAPDFGPPTHPTAGHTLVTARPPLIAFNVEIDATLEQAKAIAAEVRTLPGVRALGVPLTGAVQVTTNLEDYARTSPARLIQEIRKHARVVRAELVAMAPEAAFADFPDDVSLGPGFEPDRQFIERRLRVAPDAP
jgi:glutamate formiminotransferase